ncbi:DUF962 domain-containing protein [Dyella marensis]|uniref:Mpo1 family 2-hydroxy fatty acid dioxygenase n=1 Tax=Dyella marensis TaxID=500610 RepID=UPI0031D11EBE
MRTAEPRTGLGPWLDSYAGDHRHPVNQRLHEVCVPLILWSAIALMWTIPVPALLGRPGFWSVAAQVLAFAWYWKHSRRMGGAMFVVFVLLDLPTAWIHAQCGASVLRWSAVAVFAVAWVGQFVGHAIEGRRPSFLTDLSYLLVGPAWLLDKLMRRLGLGGEQA